MQKYFHAKEHETKKIHTKESWDKKMMNKIAHTLKNSKEKRERHDKGVQKYLEKIYSTHLHILIKVYDLHLHEV
jgi:hypothetical protein